MSSKIRRDPPMLPHQHTCKVLFVGEMPTHLSSTALHSNLHSLFETMPGFQSISVQVNKSRKPLGHAYVNFTTPKHANNALQVLRFKIIIANKQCSLMHKRDRNEVSIPPECTLFIQNLHDSVSEEELYTKFSKFDIIDCKIRRDQNTHKSLGYGYISFVNKTSTQKAMQQMNGTQLKGNILKVEQFIPKCQRQSMRKYTKPFTNVYVKNIPSWMSEKQLISMFERATNGKITSTYISNNTTSQTFALLNFDTTQHAIDAINQFNGKMFHGQSLYVAKAESRNERDFKLAQAHHANINAYVPIFSKTNLKIKNLASTVSDRQLFARFKSFGWIKRHSVHGAYGFVEFGSPKSAQNAMRALNNTKFHRRRILVSFAQEAKPINAYHSPRNMYFNNQKRYHLNNNRLPHRYHMIGRPSQQETQTNDTNPYLNDPNLLQMARQQFNPFVHKQYEQLFANNNNNNNNYNTFQQQFEENSALLFEDDNYDYEVKHEQNNFSDLNSLNELAKKRLLKKDLSSKIQDLYPDCASEIVDELLKLDDDIVVGLMQNDHEVELLRMVIKIEGKLKQNELKEENINKDELPINDEVEKEEKKVDIECQNEQKELSEVKDEENKEINDVEDVVNGNEVENWLTNIVSLPKYIKYFISAGFEDLETIKTMNEDDLKEIGIKILGHRRKFLMYIKKLKTSKDNYPDEGIKM